MNEREELAEAILGALCEDEKMGWVDWSHGLDDVCIDGFVNMLTLADKLIAAGWLKGAGDE